jgi:hypothetical protein
MAEKSVFKNKNLYFIFGVTLIAMMGVASITPAFPDIIRYFNISPQQVGWLIVAFTLPGIFLTPFTGILADRYGRKVVNSLLVSVRNSGVCLYVCARILLVAGPSVCPGNWGQFLVEYEHYAGGRPFRRQTAHRSNGLQCQCAEYCYSLVPGTWWGNRHFWLAVYFCTPNLGYSVGHLGNERAE